MAKIEEDNPMSSSTWDKGDTPTKERTVSGSVPDRPAPERDAGFTRLHAFLTIFVVVYLMEAMGGMYIVSAIQNIEKQFRLPSRLSGFLVSASDIGYIPTVIFVAYFGAKGNRAKWIGLGTLGMAIAYLLIASPNFLFPTPPVEQSTFGSIKNALKPSAEMLSPNAPLHLLLQYPLIKDRFPAGLIGNITKFNVDEDAMIEVSPMANKSSPYITDLALLQQAITEAEKVVSGPLDGDASTVRELLITYVKRRAENQSAIMTVERAANAPFSFCSPLINGLQTKIMDFKCIDGESSHGPFIVFVCALFLLGIGRTLPWSLGVPLIDDNVSKKSVPLYFGAMSFIRILGPITGFLVASIVNKFYYNFSPPIGLNPTDSSWIGAWWLGFIVIGCITCIPSIALVCFPSKKISVPSGNKKACREINFNDKHIKIGEEEKDKTALKKIKDFGDTYKSVLSSQVYRYSAIGRVLDILAVKGYLVFLPKYLEYHFGIARYLVHRYMAMFGIFGFALGSGMGGLIMRKYKLTGKQAALWVLVVSCCNLCIYSSKIFISCDSALSHIGHIDGDKMIHNNLTETCNMDCQCQGSKLYPVCDKAGHTFFSPCHAGCRDVFTGEKDISFSSCSCAEGGVVNKYWCKTYCTPSIVLFFTTVLLGSFMGGLHIVPGLLIILRSVPPATRSAALGLQGFLVSLFGTLPSPIFWGLIVDSTCRIWEESCNGGKGSCSVYDPAALRVKLHTAYVVIRMIALVFDALVYRIGDTINLNEDSTESVTQEVTRNSIKLRDLSVSS